MSDDHEDGFTCPATLTVGGREVAVEVILDARHEPVDGRMHWFGRVCLDERDAREEALVTALTAGPVQLRTESGQAEGKLGDVDPPYAAED